MYTVARFLVGPEQLPSLVAIGERMNAGLRARGDGIARDVTNGGPWKDQLQSMAEFVQAFQQDISAARALGADITFDVAIEPEDVEQLPLVLRQKPEWMSTLANAGIALEVSIYFSGDQER